MVSEKKVSFPYRGEHIEGTIKRLNRKTVTVIVNGQILFRVPYQLLTPKIKPPLKKNMKKNSYTNKEWTKEQNRDYKKSNNTEINLVLRDYGNHSEWGKVNGNISCITNDRAPKTKIPIPQILKTRK